jgi:hypothetical protein
VYQVGCVYYVITTLYIYSVHSLSLSLSLSLYLSISPVLMKVTDSNVLWWVRGQRKMSQVLEAFGLLDFTMLRPIFVWREF